MSSIKSRSPHWRYVDETIDEDDTGAFDWQRQGFPPRFAYRLTFQIEDHRNSGSGVEVNLRVEGDSTSNYKILGYDGSAWSENILDRWQLGYTDEGRALYGSVIISGGRYVVDPPSTEPTMRATIGTRPDNQQVLGGRLLNNYSTVTDIHLYVANGASTGFATLEAWGPISDR